MPSVCIVIPAYNDWESVTQLLINLGKVGREQGIGYRVLLVDDSSTLAPPEAWTGLRESTVDSLKIVRLACNLGHQRAIAVGLVIAAKQEIEACSAVVVMDGDGEDRPEDVPRLLQLSSANPDSVVCARRARRSEPLIFRLFYHIYKLLFGQLTGVRIDFGNFCLIPATQLRPLISQAGIWNHLAATLTRARVPLRRIDTIRGERYVGQSKMNFVSLVVHGLSAVAVYADVALVRLVLLAMVVAGLALLAILITIAVRFLTPLAIPGWTSNVVGALSIILCQAVLIPATGVLVVLSLRTLRMVVPLIDAENFIESVRTVYLRSDG